MPPITPLEIAANGVNALSIFLAGRNSVHTWWTGIIGCLLFGLFFYTLKLYAEATLQGFFIATSVSGWIAWAGSNARPPREIRRTGAAHLTRLAAGAIVVAAGYGWLLHRFTDAWNPFVDSLVLTFSVLAQFLLMARRIESWPVWFIVNSLSIPLYISREAYLTAGFYSAFWVNAIVSFVHWRRLLLEPDVTLLSANEQSDAHPRLPGSKR